MGMTCLLSQFVCKILIFIWAQIATIYIDRKICNYKWILSDHGILYYRPTQKCMIFKNFRRKLSQPLVKILRITFWFTSEDKMCWKLNCSSNAMNNLTSKKQKVCSLCYWKPEEEKDARGVTCFMEENEISLREVARFDEHKRD